MSSACIQIRPVGGSLGAEIRGLELRRLDDGQFARVHAALLEHEVIFFRETDLDDEAQMELAHRFGQPSVFPLMQVLGATGPTFQVIEDGPNSPNEADDWHTDVTWAAEPPKIALLRMGVRPASGGDTMWGSMTAAYEALSPLWQSFVSGLEVIHDNTSFIEAARRKMGDTPETRKIFADLRAKYPPVTHPLVRTHPETKRRALLWGGGFMRSIVGMHPDESDAVLGYLRRHIARSRFQVRWQWRDGDLAVWDERSTVHQAVNDHFPQRRVVHRCVVDGDRPSFDPHAVPAGAAA